MTVESTGPGELQTCGRRMAEWGPWKHEENLDRWRTEPNGDRTCSFCGSMHPDDFLAFIKKIPEMPGWRVDMTYKRYKVYVHRPEIQNASQGAIKFYTHHIRDQAMEDALNEAMVPARELSVKRFQDVLERMKLAP